MRKSRLGALCVLLCMLLCLLGSCSNRIEYNNGVYTDPKTGYSYQHAPFYYEAISLVKDEPIGSFGDKNKITLYPISNLDPSQAVCTQNYEVLYAGENPLPELDELKPIAAHICKTVELSFSYATVTDAEQLAYLIESFSGNGFSAAEIDPGLTKEKYELKIEASNLPGIYYCLTYWRFSGDVLIYEDIESTENFKPTYEGVAYSFHTYESGAYEGRTYVAYNFGREILYNRTLDKALGIDNTLAVYLDGAAA